LLHSQPLSKPATLAAWLARLEQLHPVAIDLGLDRVRQVSLALGIQPDFPLVIVGGTNGKGSTCAYLEAMFAAAGYKTGLYTSPHLLRYNERVRIGGVESSDADLIAAFERIEAARGDTSLTYYEFGTLGALLQFIAARVAVGILEVGLGGRLDAVNIYDADAAIVTSVDLDHQAYLGDTREAIGFEKAGIYRAGRAALCADPAPPASLIAHIVAIGAEPRLLGQDFRIEPQGVAWTYRGSDWSLDNLPLPTMHGAHQLANAAGAIAVLETLHARLPVAPQAIVDGLLHAQLTGRFQRIASAPEVVVDVAHNPHAARALAATLDAQPHAGCTLAVVGMLGDKDADGVIAALADCVDLWFVATPDTPRALAASALAEIIRRRVATASVTCCDDPVQALAAAKSQATVDDRIVVFGSFYTVAAVLACAEPQA
jgi:dihydrofolate synthase/folylpolyglutamate synthase